MTSEQKWPAHRTHMTSRMGSLCLCACSMCQTGEGPEQTEQATESRRLGRNGTGLALEEGWSLPAKKAGSTALEILTLQDKKIVELFLIHHPNTKRNHLSYLCNRTVV